jgi:hypothetical protein
MSDKPWRVVPRSATDRPDVLEDDHARGCQGREYTCTCGYDERVADEIKRLRDALHAIAATDTWMVGSETAKWAIRVARQALGTSIKAA